MTQAANVFISAVKTLMLIWAPMGIPWLLGAASSGQKRDCSFGFFALLNGFIFNTNGFWMLLVLCLNVSLTGKLIQIRVRGTHLLNKLWVLWSNMKENVIFCVGELLCLWSAVYKTFVRHLKSWDLFRHFKSFSASFTGRTSLAPTVFLFDQLKPDYTNSNLLLPDCRSPLLCTAYHHKKSGICWKRTSRLIIIVSVSLRLVFIWILT